MKLDTLPAKAREILPSARPFATCPCEHRRRGGLSRSVVSRRTGTRSRLPSGTESTVENVEGRVMVTIQYQTTRRTDMGAHAERLLHPEPTPAAILRREACRNRYNGDAMYLSIVAHPREEQAPTGITDGLCQVVILDQMGNLQVFK